MIQPRAERDILRGAPPPPRGVEVTDHGVALGPGIRAKIEKAPRSNPERRPVDPDSEAYGREVRVLLHGRRPGVYRILFAIEGDVVQVLTVRHAARRSLWEEMEDEGG